MADVFARVETTDARSQAPSAERAVDDIDLRVGSLSAPGPDANVSDATADVASHPSVDGLAIAGRGQLGVKRAVDILVSLALLVATAPVLALAVLAVQLTSRGPAFFGAHRVGHNGKQFKMYKVRSMYRDADKHVPDLLAHNEATGPVFKMRRDPRITPVGRFLRKFSIDELPQLWSVLVGDMSIVGPRPPLPTEVATYTPHQRQRLSVRPGMTCTWQVSGRSNIPFDQWVDMDIDYIARWSIGLDLMLLLRTIPAVLSGRGAY